MIPTGVTFDIGIAIVFLYKTIKHIFGQPLDNLIENVRGGIHKYLIKNKLIYETKLSFQIHRAYLSVIYNCLLAIYNRMLKFSLDSTA